jgi:phage tail protein X
VIRRTLDANSGIADKPQLLRHVIQKALQSLAEKSDQLRKAKPTDFPTELHLALD